MRRVRLDDALSVLPAGGYVEICQDEKNANSANDQYAPISLFAAASVASDLTNLEDVVKLGDLTAVTATVDGLTTGLIPTTARFVQVTSDSVDKQVSLPIAIAGKEMKILVLATGCELISTVAAHKVNNVVVGATNEAALVAGTLYTLVYDGVNNWVMTGLTALGAVETPVVPDIL